MKKVIELRNITLRTKAKKGDSVSLDFEACASFKDEFTEVRGEILEQSMAIIAELNHFFETLDIQEPDSEPGQGFMDKWKLFRQTLHKLPEFESATKETRKKVHESIGIRDKYAHADLGFTNNQPEIKYEKREAGRARIVVEPINEKTRHRDLHFLEDAKDDLRSLNLSLRKHKNSRI
ncbi:MAG: hypothetical protein LN417_08665 [Candidatus Thermoplasmatota archaeon]|nr:hypothetical protein [Candidatus Thermoplasmatota archaeon]